ncbi:MAG: NACHT domain-containing protein [Cyanobacteria bacterium P01_D01_bin.156]
MCLISGITLAQRAIFAGNDYTGCEINAPMAMLGDFINGIVGPIFDATWSSLKAQYHQGLEETDLKQEQIKAHKAIAAASEAYYQNYRERHCKVKVLRRYGSGKDMGLDTIYTAVKFLSDADRRYFSTDHMEELYRQAGNRRFRVGSNERQDGLKVANAEQYLMVLGGPGVGKSTFLRKLGLESLKGAMKHEQMPVFIELKSFKSKEMSLEQAIVRELEISGFPYADSLVKSMLAEGRLLVLLDGLDEVPSSQVDNVIEQIQNFCDQHRKNRFVASCRVAAYKGGFNRFTDVTMAEFDNDQIREFVESWFSSKLDKESGTADTFWKLINQSENASAKDLAQTPLLLTFLCLVYDSSQALPTVRSTLYGDALDILLKKWAAEKRIRRDSIYQGFHADLEKVLLSEIAHDSFQKDQLFFSESEITERITTFLADTLDAPSHLDGAKVLNAIEVQQGILVERAAGVYSFSHLTLQEYLTARYISKKNLMQTLVENHLTDERWREIFLLVSGLLEEQAQDLWLLMEQQANGYLDLPKLQGLLQWLVDLSNKSDSSNQQLASRSWLLASAIAIAMTIDIDIVIASGSATATVSRSARAIARAIASARAIAIDSAIASAIAIDSAIASAIDMDIAIDIASASAIDMDIAIDIASASASANIDYNALATELEALQKQIPSGNATAQKWQNFADQLIETYLSFFKLDKSLIMFSLEEAQALENYLYSVKLIIDCKNAAVRVSRQEWEAIESRLLTPQQPPT